MSRKNDLLQDLINVDGEIDALKVKRNSLMEQLITRYPPFKAGDVVNVENNIPGVKKIAFEGRKLTVLGSYIMREWLPTKKAYGLAWYTYGNVHTKRGVRSQGNALRIDPLEFDPE